MGIDVALGGCVQEVPSRAGLCFNKPMSKTDTPATFEVPDTLPAHWQATALPGAYVIDPRRFGDERGFFSEAWKPADALAAGIIHSFVRTNVSFSVPAGTLRGLHAQAGEAAEAKLVRCIRGAIVDVIVDIRPDSPAYCQWIAVELTAENRQWLYVPAGFLHGFQTLVNDTEVLYQTSNIYAPEAEIGARYNDPAFNIIWPGPAEKTLSDKDTRWPDFLR